MRIAFIGGWGHHYLRGALSDPGADVARPVPVAGDGYDNTQARAFADKISGAQWFDSALEMLDKTRPDVVSVGAVYARNAEFIMAALERDIPVVSDKPICANWADFHRLETLTRGMGRMLLTEFPFRAQREFRAMRTAVREGAIGDVVLATAQKSYKFGQRPAWYADRALYGGTILWVASHGIDILRFTTQQTLSAVCGRQGNVSRPDFGTLEDHTVSLFALSGGGTGVVHADLLRAAGAEGHGDDRVRLAGSRGTLEVRGGRCRLAAHDHPEIDITDTAPPTEVYRELLAALAGTDTEYYSTAASLETARVLLEARDRADAQKENTP